jgi:Ca2+/Na+ antiporter
MRDMPFIILGLLMFYHFLATDSLALWQCFILMLLFCVYVTVICYQQSKASTEVAAKGKKDQHNSDEEYNNCTVPASIDNYVS